MTSLTLSTVLQLSLLSTGAETYAEAHKINAETGRPIVVLIGADWCPGCRAMKNSVMPKVAKQGLLKKVAYAQVNTDKEAKLAGKLMRGSSIPQLIMYRKTEDGWKRYSLVGAQSAESIEAFINQGLESEKTKLASH
ncbi:MAG TPA: thioredoxin family protein [Pirellulales bacterium]|nr:thioredoxin family protein [Pirellulales bacterium]